MWEKLDDYAEYMVKNPDLWVTDDVLNSLG